MAETDDVDVTVPEFLDSEGAVGLIVQSDYEDGVPFGELNSVVHVSHTTLSNRKKEAVKLGFLELVRSAEDHGNTKRYRLTDRGKALRAELKEQGIAEQYRKFFEEYRELEEQRDELVEWAGDADVNDPDWPYDPDPAHDYFED